MTWAAVAIGGGALLGAGGTIAGGILSKPDKAKQLNPSILNLASAPLSNFNILDLLASQGVAPPESVVSQSGPVQQALAAFMARFPTTDAQWIQNATRNLFEGNETPLTNRISQALGYPNIAALLEAQKKWEVDIQPRLEELRQIATLSGSRQLNVERGLAELSRNPLNFNELRDAERARLNRELDDRQTEALRSASAGGYNPGSSLQQIERQRSDADLDALTRAVGLLAGQGQSISQLQALNPANRAQQYAPGSTNVYSNTTSGPTGFAPTQTDPFGAAVAGASNQLGGALSSLGLLQYLNQKPTVNPNT